MKLHAIYDLAIAMGKACDVRSDTLSTYEQDQTAYYDALSSQQKAEFDKERFKNPYSDTRILYGNGAEEIQGVFCGIDMETPEILLADRLREKGLAIDLILAHHPEGVAQAGLHEVMPVQEYLMVRAGVPVNIAEGIMASRISEVKHGFMPMNHQRAVDAARLLDIPFMCVHSPADNLVNNFLDNLLAETAYKTVDDIMDILLDIPEYQEAQKLKAGPVIINGSGKNKAGKVFCKMTGGTGGPDTAFEKLAQAGVGTYLCMHIQEKHRKAAKEHHINVVVAGHMASDSIGMNLFLDQLGKKGVAVTAASGLIRVRR